MESYSSSSEDEETPNKRTKRDLTSQSSASLPTSNETPENDENKDEGLLLKDNKLEQKSDPELQKGENKTEGVSAFDKEENSSEDKVIELNSSTEDVLHSYNQKDEDGCRTSDIFGRDSSSEDEDYDFEDGKFIENDFVHINEIDFTIFP